MQIETNMSNCNIYTKTTCQFRPMALI